MADETVADAAMQGQGGFNWGSAYDIQSGAFQASTGSNMPIGLGGVGYGGIAYGGAGGAGGSASTGISGSDMASLMQTYGQNLAASMAAQQANIPSGSGGMDTGTIIILAIVAVVVVLAVMSMTGKKKKK